MNMHKHDCREGFTLIELSISLVFISILSIAVVLVIMGAISSYHRGITLNKVDSVGTSLVEDIGHSIRVSAAGSLTKKCKRSYSDASVVDECEADGGKNFASVVWYATVEVGDNELDSPVPVFGAFCTGSYSYIWNSGYFFDTNEYTVKGEGGTEIASASLKYRVNDGEEAEKKNFKLLKIEDGTRAVCESAIKDVGSNIGGEKEEKYKIDDDDLGSVFDMSAIANTSEEPTEFLSGSAAGSTDDKNNETNLAVYDLTTTVTEQADVYKNIYYYNSLILGTVRGGIDISVSGNNCATPEGVNQGLENLDYCAINRFNFAALAKGSR